MSVYKCKMCGGDLQLINEENGLFECDSCGSIQTAPIQDDTKKTELYNTANAYRKDNHFDRAAEIYADMVKRYPEEAEAYWGMVLCRYGIEYVEDPKTGKMIPTCHRTIPKSIFDDADYRQACEKAKTLAREKYQQEAAVIDQIQEKILKLVQNEEPYDIFISYKEQEDDTKERTEDSVLAQDIYERLTAEGYKVFFSRISLENRLGEDYEPIIYSALHTSKVMLLIGTTSEHMNATWVRNEWTRYLDMMDEEPGKKTLIPVYAKMDPYDIPREISGRHLQAQNAGKIGFQQDLLHRIKKLLKSNQENVAPVAYGGSGSVGTGGMIERGFICLKDRNFQEAESVFDKILNIDPHSGGAYLGRLMIRRGVSNIEDLEYQTDPLSIESDYQHAIEYGEPKIKKTLREFDKKIVTANREAAVNFVREKLFNLDYNVQSLEAEILNNQTEVNGLTEVLKKQQKVVDKNTRAVKAMKISRLIILAFHLLFWVPVIISVWQGNGAGAGVITAVIVAVLWKFVIGKFIATFVQKVVGLFAGKTKDEIVVQAAEAIADLNASINEKTDVIRSAQAKVDDMGRKAQKLKDNQEMMIDRLSLVARDGMEDEINKLTE